MAQQSTGMDQIGWKILELLQKDARISFAELGRKAGLSTPAVAERVRRLEEAGIITGYHASLNLKMLGLPIRVLIRLTIHGGDLQVKRAVAVMREMAEVARCYRVTGQESFVLEADVVSVRHLEELIDKLSPLGATATSTVLSCPVDRREYRGAQILEFEKYQ
jgi:Lrp/AsnC family leucine-responsive transcriptional regulator